MPDQSSPAAGSSFVKIKINPDPGFVLTFIDMTGNEELGRPFHYDINLSSGTVKADLTAWLGSSLTITLTTPKGKSRYFNGIVTRASYNGLVKGAYHYHVELRPWIWLLSRKEDCKIFQNQSPWAIITGIFREAGFSDFQDKRQSQSGDQTLDYCVQYCESSFDFVTRLMELWGIYYYYEHSDGQHSVILADDPNSHTVIDGKISYQSKEVEQRLLEDHIWEWYSEHNLQPGSFTLRDYNFTTPSNDLTSKSVKPGKYHYGSYEVYRYPGPYETTAVGQKLAAIRMQDLSARIETLSGASNSRRMHTGCKFSMSKHPDEEQNREYLVINASYSVAAAEGMSQDAGGLLDTFECVFHAIPGTVPFKLDELTPKPIIRGPQTAKVVGESGEEVTTDKYGRIKVQFYWDRVGTNDQNSSCWIRVAQSWGGAGWGAMFIPRIGMEVVVEFLEGNPDRPLVTGVVYNATQTVPYPLPDKKVVTTFKSNSSKGGGGFNELRFDDTKGKEEIFFQAQYDYNKVVLHNETVKITQDTTTTVDKGNRVVTVNTGNDTHTVSQGNRTVTVSQGNDEHTVSQGNRKVTVSAGNDDHTVSQGNQSLTVSAGNQKIDVSAGGSKTSTGQAFEITAGTSVKLTATASIELTCGGTSLKLDPSGLTISAPMVKASASAEMTLDGGGMMSISGGLVKIN